MTECDTKANLKMWGLPDFYVMKITLEMRPDFKPVAFFVALRWLAFGIIPPNWVQRLVARKEKSNVGS